jgi:hypothetical protein
MGKRRILTHFTDDRGLAGITGLASDALKVGKVIVINSIQFGIGLNSNFAQRYGDIFVTELPPNSNAGLLMQIGVFGMKQQFAISFDAEDAFHSGVRINDGWAERNIFVVAANSVISGTVEVLKRF